jgi:hypothetical protein
MYVLPLINIFCFSRRAVLFSVSYILYPSFPATSRIRAIISPAAPRFPVPQGTGIGVGRGAGLEAGSLQAPHPRHGGDDAPDFFACGLLGKA